MRRSAGNPGLRFHPARLPGLLVGLASLVTVVGLVLTVALGVAARDDRFCVEVCHSMKGHTEARDVAPHESVSCVRCHGASGFTGVLIDGLSMDRRIISELMGESPGIIESADAPCRECHHAVLIAPVVSRGIAIRHIDFRESSCNSCHAGSGHALEGRVYETSQMDDCMSCHSTSGREAEGCDLCHIPSGDGLKTGKSTIWRVTHGPEWRTTHGMGDLEVCINCHIPAYCAGCHEVALPHPPGWSRTHGDTADSTSLARCESCHTSSWCTDCHGTLMPHAEGFIEAHGKSAERDGEDVCARCHPQATCDECHYRSAHPDVPGVGTFHTGGSR